MPVCLFDELFCANLPADTSAAEVEELFSAYGVVKDHWVGHKKHVEGAGGSWFASVRMASYEESLAARNALDGCLFRGRKMVVKWAANERLLLLKPLASDVTEAVLISEMSRFGHVERVAVRSDEQDDCRHGLVLFRDKSGAKKAFCAGEHSGLPFASCSVEWAVVEAPVPARPTPPSPPSGPRPRLAPGFLCLCTHKSVTLDTQSHFCRDTHDQQRHEEMEVDKYKALGASVQTMYLPGGGLMAVNPSKRLVMGARAHRMAVFMGTLTNYDDLVEKFGIVQPPPTESGRKRTLNVAELVCVLYSKMGLSMLSELQGKFAFCMYDPRLVRVLAVRDPQGTFPVVQAYTVHDHLVIACGPYLPTGHREVIELQPSQYKYGWHAPPLDYEGMQQALPPVPEDCALGADQAAEAEEGGAKKKRTRRGKKGRKGAAAVAAGDAEDDGQEEGAADEGVGDDDDAPLTPTPASPASPSQRNRRRRRSRSHGSSSSDGSTTPGASVTPAATPVGATNLSQESGSVAGSLTSASEMALLDQGAVPLLQPPPHSKMGKAARKVAAAEGEAAEGEEAEFEGEEDVPLTPGPDEERSGRRRRRRRHRGGKAAATAAAGGAAADARVARGKSCDGQSSSDGSTSRRTSFDQSHDGGSRRSSLDQTASERDSSYGSWRPIHGGRGDMATHWRSSPDQSNSWRSSPAAGKWESNASWRSSTIQSPGAGLKWGDSWRSSPDHRCWDASATATGNGSWRSSADHKCSTATSHETSSARPPVANGRAPNGRLVAAKGSDSASWKAASPAAAADHPAAATSAPPATLAASAPLPAVPLLTSGCSEIEPATSDPAPVAATSTALLPPSSSRNQPSVTVTGFDTGAAAAASAAHVADRAAAAAAAGLGLLCSHKISVGQDLDSLVGLSGASPRAAHGMTRVPSRSALAEAVASMKPSRSCNELSTHGTAAQGPPLVC